ncbi:MAG: LptE family protein [Sediminibacterium sp.]
MSTCCLLFLTGCGIYKFNDAVIPSNVKTIKINYIDNKARYINPQAAPKFYDKIQQKIIGSTKITRSTNDDADYVLSGVITTYDGTQTVGVSSQQASTNRLTVTLSMEWRNNVEQKTEKFDVTRSFDYSANKSFQAAEAELLDEIVRTLTDDIFNRMFSNW